MKEFNAEEIRIETASALNTVKQAQVYERYPAYIGLDVHKENIVYAVARAGREVPESRGGDCQQAADSGKAGGALEQRIRWRGTTVLL